MTHIAVERNRRRQMNEYLAALRSIMPEAYVQRVRARSRVANGHRFVSSERVPFFFCSLSVLVFVKGRKRRRSNHGGGMSLLAKETFHFRVSSEQFIPCLSFF